MLSPLRSIKEPDMWTVCAEVETENRKGTLSQYSVSFLSSLPTNTDPHAITVDVIRPEIHRFTQTQLAKIHNHQYCPVLQITYGPKYPATSCSDRTTGSFFDFLALGILHDDQSRFRVVSNRNWSPL